MRTQRLLFVLHLAFVASMLLLALVIGMSHR